MEEEVRSPSIFFWLARRSRRSFPRPRQVDGSPCYALDGTSESKPDRIDEELQHQVVEKLHLWVFCLIGVMVVLAGGGQEWT